MKTKTIISLLLGFIISALALYLSFRNVPLSDLLRYLESINYFWILPSVLVVLIGFALRALRWQIILASAHKVSFWSAFHPLMIGFMINCILPGRIGEIARPAALQTRENIPFSTGLATVAAERVFDVSLLLVLFAALLVTVKIDPNLDLAFGKYHLNRQILVAAGKGVFQLFILMLAGMAAVGFSATRKLIISLIKKAPSLFFFAGDELTNKIKNKICRPLIDLVENFASGLALIKYPARICACIGLSVAVWSLSGFSYYLMAQGCPGIELSFAEMFVVMIVICFVIALPSVPGFWGVWEAGGVFALALFGISAKEAAGFTLANHAVQMLPVIVVGIVSALVTSVNVWQVSYQSSKKKSP